MSLMPIHPVALVTGATGFVGRTLCARLQAEGWRVVALAGRQVADGPWEACHAVDVADAVAVDALERVLPGAIDTVFHLAGKAHALAELGADPVEYDRINAGGTANLKRLATRMGVRRFVLASTVKAMGEGEWDVWDESRECHPDTPYGISKLAAEGVVLQAGGPEAVVLRLSMVYGGKDRGNLTRMVEAVRRRRFPSFPETGNRRSMVHVEDVASAFLLAATHPAAAGEVFIITDGRFYSTRQIYLGILKALGRRAPRIAIPLWCFRLGAKCGDVLGRLAGRRMPLDSDSLAKLTDSAAFSCAKAVQVLGYAPKWDLEKALLEQVHES